MACKYTSLLISLCLYLAFSLVALLPTNPNNDWLFPINKLVIYTFVKESEIPPESVNGNTYNLDHNTATSILIKLLKEKDLRIDDVNAEQATSSVLKGWQKMMYNLKQAGAKGGSATKKIFQKWKDQIFNAKLGNAKRELEEELYQERKKKKARRKKS